MPTPPVPCRLFVMLAREAPVALIFRRGPSRHTQLIRWNLENDTFESGAWFRGQIYPERSDISPDGTKLIYLAADNSMRNRKETFPMEWTAISKVPWLTALVVWENRGTYYGGGLFHTNNEVWINESEEPIWTKHLSEKQLEETKLPVDLEVHHLLFWDHHWHMFVRLEDAGWEAIEEYPNTTNHYFSNISSKSESTLTHIGNTRTYNFKRRAVHKKTRPVSHLYLVMTSVYQYPGTDSQTFEVRDDKAKTVIPIEGAVWADWDKRGRLLYAKEGKIFTADIVDSRKLAPTELADFNSARPERTHAPEWARHW